MRYWKLTLAFITLSAALFGVAALVAGPVVVGQERQADRFTVVAHRLVAAINAADTDSIVREFGPQLRQLFPPDKAKTFFQNLLAQRGKILRLEAPRLIPPQQAIFRVHFERAELDLKLYLDEQNQIAGLGFAPVAADSAAPEKKDTSAGKKEAVKSSQKEAGPPNDAPAKSAPAKAHNRAETAADLFKAGKFAEAEKRYAQALAEDARNYQATLHLGHLALLSNQFEAAEQWLKKAVALQPEEKSPKALLAEVYYRRDDFVQAAPLLAAAGREAKARQLESFKGLTPYQIESPVARARLKFIHTDPLPLVSVKVNDSEAVNFLIDTGGGEVSLDTEFAKKIGALQFGTQRGTFGGDTQADTGLGRVHSLTLGDWVIKNVPVHLLNTRAFSAAARGKPVDGILGTTLLYHFITTIDYQHGELVLRRKTPAAQRQWEQQAAAEKQTAIPFWLAGDHLIVAWGSVNQSPPMLMLVDTGLAGGGFVCPPSTINEAGIKLPEGQSGEGIFGGGKAKIVPFVVDALTLGSLKGQNISAIFGAFPTSLEYGQGFRIGGLVSHEFFRPYLLTLDFTGMKLFLQGRN